MLIPSGRLRWDWSTYASAPRTDSVNRAYSSPLANWDSFTCPRRIPRWSATSRASSGYEDPEKIIMRLRVVTSMGSPSRRWVATLAAPYRAVGTDTAGPDPAGTLAGRSRGIGGAHPR